MNNSPAINTVNTHAVGTTELFSLFQSLTQSLTERTRTLESQVQHLNASRRTGIPPGYLSKREAHATYGPGLSEKVFHLAMFTLGVNTHQYTHLTEDGIDVDTFSYEEKGVLSAVELFLEDAIQITELTCESSILHGKRFRYVKQATINI